MSQQPSPLIGVPTNIITGFLGVGKTSVIRHLLKHKPDHERWAVLVNEFGEIGLDGAMLDGEYSESQGVFVREVPGGCMCCTAGLPMRVALAQLLRQAKPDRLLIEPTGLGHPQEVLQTLNEESFQCVLRIREIMTVVDARQFTDRRYTEHETFQQQINIADVIVANKQDLYGEHDQAALRDYLRAHSLSDVEVAYVEHGAIHLSRLMASKTKAHKGEATSNTCLDRPSLDTKTAERTPPAAPTSMYALDAFSHNEEDVQTVAEAPLPECGFVKAVNHGEGFFSVGWRISARFEFDYHRLYAFLSGISAERLKATFITSSGCFAYNHTQDALTEMRLHEFDESRIEIITREPQQDWEPDLISCLSHKDHIIQITQSL